MVSVYSMHCNRFIPEHRNSIISICLNNIFCCSALLTTGPLKLMPPKTTKEKFVAVLVHLVHVDTDNTPRLREVRISLPPKPATDLPPPSPIELRAQCASALFLRLYCNLADCCNTKFFLITIHPRFLWRLAVWITLSLLSTYVGGGVWVDSTRYE